MNINIGLAKYTYKLVILILALLLPEKVMAKATKALREAEGAEKPKPPPRRKAVKKNNSS